MNGSRYSYSDRSGVEVSMWQRQTQYVGLVAVERHELAQRAGLRVVDEDEVVVLRELGGVAPVDALVDLAHLVGDLERHPLQAVVEALGDVEEVVVGGQHLPLGLEADVVHQRHERVEDLGHAAAERRGVDVQDALAPQALAELDDLAVVVLEDDALVVGDRLVADVDVAHGTSAGQALGYFGVWSDYTTTNAGGGSAATLRSRTEHGDERPLERRTAAGQPPRRHPPPRPSRRAPSR